MLKGDINETIVLECEKGEAIPLGNLLRKYTLARLTSWRPIAFSLGTENSNILSAGNEIVESMLEFSQKLSELEFECTATGDVAKVEIDFSGRLMSDDLRSDLVTCKTSGVPLLTSLDSRSIPVTIFLRKELGSSTTNNNLTFLQEKGIVQDDSNIKVMASVHHHVTRFGFTTEQTSFDKENLVLSIGNDFNSVNSKEVLLEVINKIEGVLSSIKGQL